MRVAAPGRLFGQRERAVGEKLGDDAGVDVRLPADGRRIAELFRDAFDGLDDGRLRFCHAFGVHGGQLQGAAHRGLPRTEVFRAEVVAGDGAQIVVDVFGAHRMRLARLVEILEELLTRQVSAGFDDARDPAVAHRHLLHLPAFAAEMKPNFRRRDVDVLVLERRQAVRIVVARVFLVADPERRFFEQRNDRRQNLFARQPGQPHIDGDRGANRRQSFGEVNHAIELRFVADRAPALVVAVLLAAARVAAGGLEMAVADRPARRSAPARRGRAPACRPSRHRRRCGGA